MRPLFVFLGLLAFHQIHALGQDEVKILFEATIDKDEGALVHSGPEDQYYATSRLEKGERVKVFRKEKNGWLMIAPPRGSFSWVSAADFGWGTDIFREYVHSNGTSQIASNQANVYAGSELDPRVFSTITAHLRKGDAVRILETHKLNFPDGPREMMKIQPVRGEWRWIHRDSIASAEGAPSEYRSKPVVDHHSEPISDDQPAVVRPRHHRREYASPSSVVTHDDPVEAAVEDRFVRRTNAANHPGSRRLLSIDRQFRDMVRQEAVAWDLDGIERQYRQLRDDFNDSWVSGQVSGRIEAVSRYRSYYDECLDFVRFTSETRRRDAELVVQQGGYQSALQPYPNQSAVMTAGGIQAPTQLQLASQSRAAAPSYDGAGIVRRVPETSAGAPRYALMAPDGRTLSYLQPTQGIDLEQYDGRPMGIVGTRYFRRDWNADTIAVRDLQPVQLHGYR